MVAWMSLLQCRASRGLWERLNHAMAWMADTKSQIYVASLRIRQRSRMMSVAFPGDDESGC